MDGDKTVNTTLLHQHNQPVSIESHDFGSRWTIKTSSSRILQSSCNCTSENHSRSTTAENDTTITHNSSVSPATSLENSNNNKSCAYCRFKTFLSLKELPEMVFPDNCLQIFHKNSGCSLQFDALHALQLVDSKHAPPFQVAPSAQWQERVRESAAFATFNENDMKKYDWTFRTPYTGTLVKNINETGSGGGWKIENYSSSESRLPLAKLKQQDKIYFFKEITLFEDELSDNGCSHLTVRVRIMHEFVFILLRHFFRLDHVHVRIRDTRIYFEDNNSDNIYRETSVRECPISSLKSGAPLTEPDQLWSMLPVVDTVHEVLTPSI